MLNNNKVAKIDLIRIEGNKQTEISDLVAIETKLTIFVNQQKLITLDCSPGNYKNLGIGFLFTTGILRKKKDLLSIKIERESINVEIKNLPLPVKEIDYSHTFIGLQQQPLIHNEHIAVIDTNPIISSHVIYSLISQMQKKAVFFKTSGGVHSCALADTGGSILLFSEDISRYNTIDRILGEALWKNITTEDKIMLTSCRVTSGIIKKIITGNIPIVISRSAPTDYAIRLAQQKDITLIGFARGERMNVYTCPGRLDI